MTKEELENGFIEYAQDDIEGALSLITGLFVGINEAYVEYRGDEGDGQKQINIEGMGARNITIHAA